MILDIQNCYLRPQITMIWKKKETDHAFLRIARLENKGKFTLAE